MKLSYSIQKCIHGKTNHCERKRVIYSGTLVNSINIKRTGWLAMKFGCDYARLCFFLNKHIYMLELTGNAVI